MNIIADSAQKKIFRFLIYLLSYFIYKVSSYVFIDVSQSG